MLTRKTASIVFQQSLEDCAAKRTMKEALIKTPQMHWIEGAFGIIGLTALLISNLFGQLWMRFLDCAHEGSGGMMVGDDTLPFYDSSAGKNWTSKPASQISCKRVVGNACRCAQWKGERMC